MVNQSCVSCNSSELKEIVYDGYFQYQKKKYPMKTKYTKCSVCGTEFLTTDQVKENQEFLRNIKTE